ncbi:HlyD family type I secretion periplasmic adaptor subunit [Thalassobius sp. I31.1]|uniref:HlyD family type I secretion periplasmic adaptor subunit n=1 Tax=Thalassobius sp. I31.1 TaxID=2109912 RepID=UPI001E2B4E03|nr:HlyD family type I secretion periplasmic adaptor subunit [Thalassobius sp. I31.1]
MKMQHNPDEVDFPIRGRIITGVVALGILLGGGGLWAFTTQIAGAVVSSGQIRVEQQSQAVQHPDGGVVEEILVEEGELVQRGDLLIRLDPALLQSELTGQVEQRYELLASMARFEAERDNAETPVFSDELMDGAAESARLRGLMISQETLFETRRTTLQHTLDQLQNRKTQINLQLEGIAAQHNSLNRQIELLRQELETQQSLLDRGLSQAATVLALQREEARLLGQIGEFTATAARANEQISEIDLEALSLTSQRREDAISAISSLRYELITITTQITSLQERLQRLDVHAPVSGVVHGLKVFAPRAVLRPADDVMALIPQDRPLVLVVNIEPIHIDQIYIQQPATLRFPAFSAQDTPELFGYVSKVSADAFTDENTGANYYRAEVALNEGEAARLPQDVTLLPGMPVEAYIRTSDRTPITYLVKPLSDYFNRAFRED